jgi:predicted Kef-type K+ transport protein
MTLSSVLEDYRWTAVAVLGVALAVAGNVIALRPFKRKKAA